MDSSTLANYQPDIYKNSKLMAEINRVFALELDRINNKTINTSNQFIASTADTSLDRWEIELGLAVKSSDETSYRQSKIISRLRGQGTITPKAIENIAESFENGDVDVIQDYANYIFTIKFVGDKGIPPNLNDLQETIAMLKPGHLICNYEFTYLTWDEYESKNMTLDQWDALNLTWDEFEVYQ